MAKFGTSCLQLVRAVLDCREAANTAGNDVRKLTTQFKLIKRFFLMYVHLIAANGLHSDCMNANAREALPGEAMAVNFIVKI
jgi:hypothetical protein